MKCKNLRIRSKKYERYFFCKLDNKQITLSECKSCSKFDFKRNKPIKNKSTKQRKLENSRYSIITDDLLYCYICTKAKKQDLHEIFGGCNRRKSIEWGLVIPVCRKCHEEWKTNEEIKKSIQEKAKKIFYSKYSEEKFLQEFGKRYI